MTAVSPQLLSLLTAGFALLAVSAGIWAVLAERARGAERYRARLARHAPPRSGHARAQERNEERVHREMTEILARRRRLTGRLSMRVMLDRAGLSWSVRAGAVSCAALVALTGLLGFLAGLSPVSAVLFGSAVGPAAFLLYLRLCQGRRARAMEKEFPAALDIIVRGVKSGLPLIDCLGIVARELPDPLGAEFARMIEQQSHGVALADAVDRMAARIPLAEVNFFAIVVGLQSRTGGRLSESLDNLVSVLRARTQLRAKVKSMSAEAKASGGIIGALPVVVTTLVYLTSPQYIGLLFSEAIGNVVLVGSTVWMVAGVLVMTKMIRFEV